MSDHPGLSMTKLKNALRKLDADLVPELRNVRVNAQLQGCSGFVTDPGSGRVVYVNTDNYAASLGQAYYRTAEHTKDFRGGRNHFASYRELPEAIVVLLKGGE